MKKQIEKMLELYNKKLDSVIGKTVEREKQRRIDRLLKKKRLSMKQLQELQYLSNPFDNNKEIMSLISDFIAKNKEEDNKFYLYVEKASSVAKGLYEVLVCNEETRQMQSLLAYYNGKDFIVVNYEQKDWVLNGVDIKDISSATISNVKYYRKYKNPLW